MTSNHAYLIAEAGVNHNGRLDLALALIDVAADAGADAVKFQTFHADQITVATAPKAAYQERTTDAAESQREMLRRLELDVTAHRALIARAAERKIDFLSSPFDLPSVDLLVRDLRLATLKIPSGEITNGQLLLSAARSGCRLIVSTGMSTMAEISSALDLLAFGMTDDKQPPTAAACRAARASKAGRDALVNRVTLLQCTSQYPAPLSEVNLRAIRTMQEAFALPIGLSDHTPGIAIPIAAAALEVAMIEKHLTLDKDLPGPDHAASLDAHEFKSMVAGVRAVESALGDGKKRPMPCEADVRRIARKGLVAARPIRKGERLSVQNLTVKRPEGTSPMEYWERLGKIAECDISADGAID